MSDLPRSFSITPFRGYRIWSTRYDRFEEPGYLKGHIEFNFKWTSPVTRAGCSRLKPCNIDNLANPDCTCGLHAWHIPEPVVNNCLFGVISGEGQIVNYKWGFRASRARISAIYSRDAKEAKSIARIYPEVAIYDDRDELLADYPPQIDANALYGPQGQQIRELIYDVLHLKASEINMLNMQTVGLHAEVDMNRRALMTKSLALRDGSWMGCPAYVCRLSMALYAFRAIAVAHLLTKSEYDLLAHYWIKNFGDPLYDFTGWASE